jgi:glycosyltransferase involved in cell wall biosynthesis
VRVVFVNPVGAVGGAERVLLDAVASLRATATPPDMTLVVGTDGPLAELAEREGVRVVPAVMPDSLVGLGDSGGAASDIVKRLTATVGDAAGYLRRLRRTIARLRPDVIHSNGIKTHLLVGLVRPRNARVVWHIHDFVASRRVARHGLRLTSRLGGVDAAIAISRAVGEDARPVLGRTPITVVPNAVDVSRFSPGPCDADTLDRLAGLPSARSVRVGLVATYANWKGHHVFLEAAARVPPNEQSPVRYYVIGGPIYRTSGSQVTEDELRTRAAALGLEGRIGFVRFQSDPVAVYRALDVVVHASTRPEPFGLTIAEAMACGRAVIVSRAGGAAELFTHDRDAVGVPPGDAAALANVMTHLSTYAATRHRLGLAARATAERVFDRTRLGPQFLAVYHSTLSRPSGRRSDAE